MLDYKLLDALMAVVETGGFERAGLVLGLSQSAVSQRIKLLETRLGQPVLSRHPTLRATPAGQQLLNHIQQVQLLERDLHKQIPSLTSRTTRLRIALNADSLATWWAEAIGAFCQREGLLLDMVIEDQDVGLRRMREGDVAACLCSAEQPVAGARSVALGQMRYRALARQSYVDRYFSAGPSPAAFEAAPAIVFGPNDQLHHRFLGQWNYHGYFPYHLCPSSEGFVRLALAGLGYGMIPDLQARLADPDAQLVDLAPGRGVTVNLYWHYWRHGGGFMERLTSVLMQAGADHLQPGL
ncbi:LysR family transcriptional regulator ArgP [Marinobacter salicampi]|uniref:LysR family transcriptional regulator ArgP n=1 Tax=Marinobacter salicampi TaxID=435907 RepID=UPI00140DFD5C|nr:LysR family transcriptional regulator ArgP [Marinobacter salicampi]